MKYLVYANNAYNPAIAVSGGAASLGESNQLGWISAAIMAGSALLPLLTGGGQRAQYQGLPGITSGGNQVIGQLQQILQAMVPPMTQQNAQQGVQAAQQLATQFDNPQIFYPARHGQDAAALTNFRAQAGQLLQQIQAAASAAIQSTPTQTVGGQPVIGQTTGGQTIVQTPTGPMVVATPAAATGGIDTSTLLLFGGGAVLLLLLLR